MSNWKLHYERNRPLTIQELEAEIEKIANDNIDCVIIPPEVDDLTDEEQIDDNLLTGLAKLLEIKDQEDNISAPFEAYNDPPDYNNEAEVDSDNSDDTYFGNVNYLPR
ncbi:hypothetical protein FQR65_LT08231 [Abscondita terminalis]|nr:hypothetical protein FQR65_LT08231 [Abscondita terminalis]